MQSGKKSLLDGGQALIDALKVLLDALHVLGELGLRLDQQLRVVAEVQLQLLLDCVQLGQSFAKLKSWKTYSFLH